MTVREKTQEIERQTLSPYAALSENTKGRARPIDECDLRTPYQRDRDRVLHSKAFRRLKHKTQVFLLPKGDHYRTRLTHTLEVSQIARTMSRALRLNDDLTEAIALGHDLGHSPFGHAGERALAGVCVYGFQHAQQGVRVVELLENYDSGLNLNFEVIDGIATHMSGAKSQTLEGDVVRAADKIAYLNHDIEDAVRAGILSEEELPLGVLQVLGRTRSDRITSLVRSVIDNSGDVIQMDAEVGAQFQNLRRFMFETVYIHPVAKSEEKKAADLVARLYEYYVRHPDRLPGEYKLICEREGAERAACDYIAGMTDTFAVDVYESLFVPQTWTNL